jgi:tripartite-type tricarboxylate transporter receptor subunit TctC
MKRLVFGAAVILAVVAPAAAWAAEDFYKGKTIHLVAGTAPGGGYDNHARFIAQFLGRHIPGNPTVIVQNMPGGNGLAAPNYVYTVSKKDGTEFGLFNRNIMLEAALGLDQATFDVEKFNWLGTTASFSDNAYLFIIRATLPHKNIDDLRNKSMPVIHVGDGTSLLRILPEALGVNINLIEGYKSTDQDAAFNRGEIDALGVGYLSILSRTPQWLTENFARPMIQFGRIDRLPALADVPTARELARNAEDLALVQLVDAPLLIGYPFALPPGVPADRVAIMRKAFEDTTRDPDLEAVVKKSKLELTPKYHEAVESVLHDLVKAPEGAKKRYRAILSAQQGG